MSLLKLACFDYDGVIADTIAYQLNMLVDIHKTYSLGRMPTIKDFQVIENLAYEPMAKHLEVPDSHIDRWLALVNDQLGIEADDRFFPGMRETIEAVSKTSHIAIVTSNIQKAVESSFRNHDLKLPLKIYDSTLGLNKGERIALAAKEFDIDITNTSMIGDSRSDIRYGKQVGAKTIAVTWGYQTKETLMKENPDYFADSPMELLDILSLNVV